MKILCTGDVHIGRRSSRLPPGIERRSHSCTEAWGRVVDLAISEKVDLVAISGDLVDEANRYFEAFGPLGVGLTRLRENEVVVAMVAGNHDHAVLPRIVDDLGLDGVHLLGRSGSWERLPFEKGGLRLNIDGWSFPKAQHSESPLSGYAPLVDGAPTLAILHGDLDQPRSTYGPISIAEMRRFPETFFLLGHVHATRAVNEPGGARALYPGSPQAMDPGETGPHGVHLVSVGPEGFASSFRPLSTVLYERLDVAVDGLERVTEIEAAVSAAVRQRLAQLAGKDEHARHLRLRVRLLGRSAAHRELGDRFRVAVSELEPEEGTLSASVEAVEIATFPARDLQKLSEMHGAAGVLARLLSNLQDGTLATEDEQLLREAAEAVKGVRSASQYLEVLERDAEVVEGPALIAEDLRYSAGVLLDELLAQREATA